MTTPTILDVQDVYKEIQRCIKEYKGPVEFGVVYADGLINVYTDRSQGFPFMITSAGEPYTWKSNWEQLEDKSAKGYAKLIFDEMLNRALRHGTKVNLPSRKKIINSKQMSELRKRYHALDDIAIAKYVIYQHVTNQTCKQCEIGIVDVEVGSYAEYHSCINCGRSSSIS